MALTPEFLQLVDRLVGNLRRVRMERLEAELHHKEQDAVSLGRANLSYYAQEQRDLCVRDLYERAEELLAAYARVVERTRLPWTDELRAQVLQRIGKDLEQDVA